MSSYKKNKTFEVRQQESLMMKEKYPKNIPVIVEKGSQDKILPDIDKNKFLVPGDLEYGKFIAVIRKRLKIDSTIAIFTFVGNNVLAMTSETMSAVYNKHKDSDGFLYVTYCGENTFG
jgi:GABA(A) receptor-associated protein